MERTYVNWLNSFPNRSKDVTSLEDICDCVVLTEAFHEIDAAHFPLESLKRDAFGNREMILSNCRKLVSNVRVYFSEKFRIHSQLNLHKLDAEAIADNTIDNVAILLEASVYAALHSDRKAQWVGNIMRLDAGTQIAMKSIIEKVMVVPAEQSHNSGSVNSEESEQLSREVENLKGKLREYEILIEQLKQEKHKMEEQKDDITQREKEISKKFENLEKQYRDIQKLSDADKHRIFLLNQSLTKLESDMEDYRDLKVKLSRQESEAQQLQHQLDALAEVQERLKKSDAIVDRYKKKIDEMGDLQKQIKELQIEVQSQNKANQELQRKVKDAEESKGQGQESKLLINQLLSEKEAFEKKKATLESDLAKVKQEKDAYYAEMISLQKQLHSSREDFSFEAESPVAHSSSFQFEYKIPQLEEEVERLKTENQRLNRDLEARRQELQTQQQQQQQQQTIIHQTPEQVTTTRPSSISKGSVNQGDISDNSDRRIQELEKQVETITLKLRESMESFKEETTRQQKEIQLLNSSLFSLGTHYYSLLRQSEGSRQEPFRAQKFPTRESK